MSSVPHIQWWVAREPSPAHMGLIKEGLRRYRYFRGAKLVIRNDDHEPVGTVQIDGDDAWDIEPAQFIAMVEDVTE